MRLAYYYPGPSAVASTTPKVISKLHERGLVEPVEKHTGNTHDTTWKLTSAGREAVEDLA
jgi:DNA-binding PadR family transcriptional regulator